MTVEGKMNANQAQAGINRLLQLGETTTPAARVAPVVERSVNERSFDQHMKQADARDARSRNEPSRPRDDARDEQVAAKRETTESSRRTDSNIERKPEAEARSDLDDRHDKVVVGSDAEQEGKPVASEEDELSAEAGAKQALGLGDQAVVDQVVVDPENAPLTDLTTDALLGGAAEVSGLAKSMPGALNGGALAAEIQDGQLNPDELDGDAPLLDELSVSTDMAGLGVHTTGAHSDAGKGLAGAPAQTSESSAAVVVSSVLQPKGGSAGRGDPTTGGAYVAPSSAPEKGAVLPLSADSSLSGDAKTPSKVTATGMELQGEKSGLTKPAVAMTPQADKWFKELAAESKGPELRSTSSTSVSGSAIADTARMPNRIAPPMATQGTMGPLQTQVRTPFGETQWGSAMAERVAFLASQRVTAAEIHLDPPELGPLQVRVTLNQEQASVSFVAQHAAVREALDQGAFRLREMFDAEGLDLVDVDVSGQSFAEQDAETSSGGEDNAGELNAEAEEQPVAVPLRTRLVDHFV